MKTFISKSSSTVISIIALAALITVTTHLTRTAERYQSAALAQVSYGQEIPGHCYGEAMNNLFAASGR
jgi:hypothetical protein